MYHNTASELASRGMNLIAGLDLDSSLPEEQYNMCCTRSTVGKDDMACPPFDRSRTSTT